MIEIEIFVTLDLFEAQNQDPLTDEQIAFLIAYERIQHTVHTHETRVALDHLGRFEISTYTLDIDALFHEIF